MTISGAVYAATGTTSGVDSAVSRLDVKINDGKTVYKDEWVDIIVKAVTKNWSTYRDYDGIIHFTTEPEGCIRYVPFQANGYEFKKTDLWMVTFSAIKFAKEGLCTVIVNDHINKFQEKTQVTVALRDGEGSGATTMSGVISITTPENNSTIQSDSVDLVGKTTKNRKVKIKVNGVTATTISSDVDGVFTYPLKNLEANNLIQAVLLDGSNKEIAKSEEILVKVEWGWIRFESISFQEGTKVSAGTKLHPIVMAQKWLKKDGGVNIVIMDGPNTVMEKLTESTEIPGKYTWLITAPAIGGTYQVNVILTNALGKTITRTGATELIVTEVAASTGTTNTGTTNLPIAYKNVTARAEGARLNLTFTVENAPQTLEKFKIQYGYDKNTLSQEVTTNLASTIKVAGQTNVYSWYIDNLEQKKIYYKVSGLTNLNAVVEGSVSDTFEVDLTPNAPQKCTVSNISGLTVSTGSSKSTITWDAIPGASSYNVYKKSGDSYTLIESVKTNSYTLYFSTSVVTYDDIAVKAVCPDGVESAWFVSARVQTGPEFIAFIVFIAGLLGFFLTRRKKS